MPVTRHYRFGAFTLESETAFPELPAAEGPTADVVFHCRRTAFDEAPARWSRQWTLPNGDPWMSMGTSGGRYLFRFPEYADFAMSADGRRVSGFRRPGVPARTVRHLFLDQVFPILLSRRGHTVLHGSAVSTPLGALAFVAPSGSGKSTLAAFFAGSGHPFLTDDCLILRTSGSGVEAVPSYPGLRLWPDVLPALTKSRRNFPRVTNYSSKRRLDPDRAPFPYAAEPAAVRRIYFLREPARDIRIESMASPRAMIELVKFNYLYDPKDCEALTAQFHGLGGLARLPLFFGLDYPRDLGELPRVCRAILEHAAAG